MRWRNEIPGFSLTQRSAIYKLLW